MIHNTMLSIDLKIKKILRIKNINIKKFVNDIGMTEQGYSYDIKNDSLKISTLIEISKYLKVEPSFFFINEQYQNNESNFSVNESAELYNLRLTDLQNENELLKATIKDKEQIIELLKGKNK